MTIDTSTPVLIVDDYKTMPRIIRNLLGQIGIVRVADALSALRGGEFGLVISDWTLAPMTGLQLLRAVRADERLKRMPFIMIIADSNVENVGRRHACRRFGHDRQARSPPKCTATRSSRCSVAPDPAGTRTKDPVMLRQYHAPRFGGGDNPLRVGVIAVGSIYYLQNEAFFRDRYGGRAICRTPWLVEAFLNGTVGAARRSRDTGLWESVHRAGRSDMARVRSLRDRRVVRVVAVRTLIVHDDLGLWQQPTASPSLPGAEHCRASRAARAVTPRRCAA